MKISSKLLFSVLAMSLVSLFAMAKEQLVFSVDTNKKNVIALQLIHVDEPQIHVTLKDAQGITIYKEMLLRSSIKNRKYDLKNLPQGDYTLLVAYDNVIKVQKVSKLFEKIELEKSDVQTVLRPTFTEHSKYVDVNMFCSLNQNISIEIRDFEGNKIHTEKVEFEGLLKKRFNLSQLEKGTYRISVEVDGIVFDEEFDQLINWSPSIATL